jgi:hypothetical protein
MRYRLLALARETVLAEGALPLGQAQLRSETGADDTADK